jgi:hypothetical protein
MKGGGHRGKGWRLPRWRGEASCISQICRVIKLIKRLTHGGLVLLSVSPLPPLLHRVSFAPALVPQALPRAVPISVPLVVRYRSFAGWCRGGLAETGTTGDDGRARMIETRKGGPASEGIGEG